MDIFAIPWIQEDFEKLVKGSRIGIYPYTKFRHWRKNAVYYDPRKPRYCADGTVYYSAIRDFYLEDGLRFACAIGYNAWDKDHKVTVQVVKPKDQKKPYIEMLVTDYTNQVIYTIRNGQYCCEEREVNI